MFDIHIVTDEPQLYDESWLGLEGEIVLGEHRERFIASLAVWTRADYERHWIAAARNILSGDRTAFITSAFQFCWPMWRQGSKIVVHEQLVLPDSLPGKFNPQNPLASVPDYSADTDAGFEVSEWFLTVADLEAFAAGGGSGRHTTIAG